MKLVKQLKQRHLERWEEAYNEHDVVGASRFAGLVVRAAVKAGWFEDVTDPAVVDDMSPAECRKLAKIINDKYVEAVTIDPN